MSRSVRSDTERARRPNGRPCEAQRPLFALSGRLLRPATTEPTRASRSPATLTGLTKHQLLWRSSYPGRRSDREAGIRIVRSATASGSSARADVPSTVKSAALGAWRGAWGRAAVGEGLAEPLETRGRNLRPEFQRAVRKLREVPRCRVRRSTLLTNRFRSSGCRSSSPHWPTIALSVREASDASFQSAGARVGN